jgi:hypothetical protein
MGDMEAIMHAVAEEMRASLAKTRSGVSHHLSKGEALEEVVRGFLQRHLPEGLAVTHGEILDAVGKRSGQADVIVYDRHRTPKLYVSDEGGHQVVPAEGVLAVVEVKTSISASDIPGIIKHMQSVKELKKSAYFPMPSKHLIKIYGEDREVFPILYFLFSFESAAVQGITEALRDGMAALPLDKRIDCVCILDGYVIMNLIKPLGGLPGDERFSAVPEPLSQLVYYPTVNSLFLWFLLITSWLPLWDTPPIDLKPYAVGAAL